MSQNKTGVKLFYPDEKPEQLSRYDEYVTGLTTEESGFASRQAQEIILPSTASRPALGPIQPHIHWVRGAGFLLGGKTDH
jgi:hypothetical protein